MIRVRTPNPAFSGVRLSRFVFKNGLAEVNDVTDAERQALQRLGYELLEPKPKRSGKKR